MTKKRTDQPELIDEIDTFKEEFEALRNMGDRLLQEKDSSGLTVWTADNDPGKPLCVGGKDVADPDHNLGVTIYHLDGAIAGVVVSDGYGDTLGRFGYLPAEIIEEEIEYSTHPIDPLKG